MSIWGKIAGAAAGLAIGGPIGALLGAIAGHFAVDQSRGEEGGDQPVDQVAFTMGVIALGAKMAKADGVVTKDEIVAFKEVFKVPEEEVKNVARVFDLAKQDIAGFESYADQLARMFADNKKLLEDVLEGLFHIAKADEVLHPAEEEFLSEVAAHFGFTETEFRYIRSRHVMNTETVDPYDVLEISPEISDEDLKTHYKKLVRENHPDKLIARGVPEEFIEISTKRLAAINQAYDELAKERGL
ncbi:MAG: TerB family tellurite resistance protein [Methyloligellaceae bacterium]